MFDVFPLCCQVFVAPCVVKFQCSRSNIKGDTATFYFLHLISHFDHMIVSKMCKIYYHMVKMTSQVQKIKVAVSPLILIVER